MSKIAHLPIAPLLAAQRAFAQHARNITSITAANPTDTSAVAAASSQAVNSAATDNLAGEIVALTRAKQGFRTSAALLVAAQQRDETLLDILD